MKLFILSKKDIKLSEAEVRAQFSRHKCIIKDEFMFVNSISKKYERLAYTKEVYSVLFSCKMSKLIETIKNYNWNKIIKKKTFKIESDFQKKEIALIIWFCLKNPKVQMKNPDILIRLFLVKGIVYATKFEWKNENKCLDRKPHTRPGFYPASIDPQLAKAMVNLAGVKGVIVDPFVGTAGILIEAAYLNHKCIGIDRNMKMLELAKMNIKHYKLKNVEIKHGDARTFYYRCPVIVTEPPFGKNTRSEDLISLYTLFLENAKRSTSKIVINFPSTVDYKKIIKKTGWKITNEFSWYIHKSLTRMILTLTI
ncbi:hypothetical protein COV16_03005 [Candidatus Woesearchaeota archaeon CG10_big_fil_rev_8_21_14_0_10_34_8]|nr:MAG: hypothetical protein COV16_03005 [Candidatus Woesearchaeota archaeon CG10_big_fil_rev_8_21_14_0_10_34_8]